MWKTLIEKEQEKGPPSELSKYAFGYSDKKPRWTFWIFPAIMTVVCILIFAGVIGPLK